MKSKSKKWVLTVIIICLLLISISIGVICLKYFETKKYKNTDNIESSQIENNIVEYHGKKYEYNDNLINILFLGIDNDTEIQSQNTPGLGGQADCIMILSMDEETKTSKILQISRDTMADIDIYDAQGMHYTTIWAQLATQYAYGNRASTSCWAMKKKVGELLDNIPIYGYISLDIKGVSIMNDYVGGVTVTIPEDYTEIDKAFIKGKTITLNGEQAEKYVRYRNIDVRGSNSLRMKRQVQYIPALQNKMRKVLGESEQKVSEFDSLMSEYLVTDLTVEDIKGMTGYAWETENVTYLPGKIVEGKETEEFHLDDEGLKKTIIDMFYKAK